MIVLILSSYMHAFCDIPRKGRPYTQYYSPSDYGAGSGTFNVVRDSLDIFYFSNDEGVLTFNGVEWNLIPIKNNKPVYWVEIDHTGTVLVASTGEIGYLDHLTNGEKIYKSLLSSSAELEFENVWEIATTSKEALFRSRKLLIQYQYGKVKTIEPKGSGFDVAFTVNDTIYTRDRGEGLHFFENGKLFLVPGGDFFANIKLNSYLPYEDKLLVGTRKGELFLLENGKVEPFLTEADNFFRKNHIYDACITQSGNYAIGTNLNGVAIIDNHGKLLQILNEDSGLPPYQFTSAEAAGSSSLWVTHAVGVSRSEILSPISYFNQSHGIDDVVTDLMIHEDSMYITTLMGLFKYNQDLNQFLKISNEYQQEFHGLTASKDGILVGGQDGLMSLKNGKLLKLSKLSIHNLSLSKNHELIYIGSDEGGFDIARSNGNYVEPIHLEGFTEQVKKIVSFEKEVFIVTLFGKLFVVDVNTEEKQIQAGIKNEFHFGNFDVVKIGDRVLVITPNGWSDFDIYGENLGFKKLPVKGKVSKIQITSDIKNGSFWICYKDEKRIDYCEKFTFKDNQLEATTDKFKPGYRINSILRGDNGIDWFGGDEGIVRFDNNAIIHQELEPLTCYINRTILDNDSILTKNGIRPLKINLPYKGSSLQFNYYSNQSFYAKDEILFQYKLEGLDNDWSTWSSKTSKEYSNLAPNEYVFQVRSKNGLGIISEFDALQFAITSPWYISIYGFISYGILFILASYSYTQWRTNNIKTSKKKLEKLIQGRTIEVELQKQALEEQREVLSQANTTKSQLLSIVGHDLRGPLNSIQGLTELIKHYRLEKKPEKVDELMGHMSDSVKRLSHLLDNLLSWALNQSGNFQLNKEKVNIYLLMNEVAGIFKETAAAKKIDIKLDIDEKLTLNADRNSLGTILRNLVSNGIKFTHENGNIFIKTVAKENTITIEIRDDGVGIPRERINEVFQLTNSSYGTSNEKGTGLGLVLVEDFVQLNGGKLAVESELDKGTTFFLTFPRI